MAGDFWTNFANSTSVSSTGVSCLRHKLVHSFHFRPRTFLDKILHNYLNKKNKENEINFLKT